MLGSHGRATAIATVVMASVWVLVAVTTGMGRVVATLPGDTHGLHVGDLLALAVCAIPVAAVWRLTRPDGSRSASVDGSAGDPRVGGDEG